MKEKCSPEYRDIGEVRMYKIEKTEFGYFLTFEGYVSSEEAQQWYDESLKILQNSPASFGVLADLRNIMPAPSDSQKIYTKGQEKYREAGMERSVVVFNNNVITLQFKRLAKISGIYEYERYLDSSTQFNWYKIALNWIKLGIDPDK